MQISSHQDLEATQMENHPVHPQMHPVGHAQPPGHYDRPQQLSMHMTAYLDTHTSLTHRQTVSGPTAPARLMEAHHS